jgi:hypothetical protein
MTYEDIPNIKQIVYGISFIHRKAPDIIQWKMFNTFIDGVGYLPYIMMFTDIANAGTVAAKMKLQYSVEGSIWKGTSYKVYDYLEVKIVK